MNSTLSSKTGFVGLISLLLALPCSASLAPAVTPITSSGLNTQVSGPIALPNGQTQFNITGGTRPGGGVNLFHSFGNFNVPTNNIANFLNDSGLPTSNILGRVTGGNISNIFGTIQTTGFGNANLFLMNPAGFLFGPNATVNVGGMVTFTSADYLRLADGARFNAIPNASADALLSTAPVAAFGFLGSNPGAITVQGSQLTVANGAGISLVGGDITMQSGTLDSGTVQAAQLSAPSGQINLVSVGKPSHHKVGGEVVIAGSGSGAGYNQTGFASLGTITLSQGSTVNTNAADFSNPNTPVAGGPISIRAGKFVMDASTMTAMSRGNWKDTPVSQKGGTIDVDAQTMVLNQSTITTETFFTGFSSAGNPFTGLQIRSGDINLNVNSLTANHTRISTGHPTFVQYGTPGALTIQGLGGQGHEARTVTLANSTLQADGEADAALNPAGQVNIAAHDIALNQTTISAAGAHQGQITLNAGNSIQTNNSLLTLRKASESDTKDGAITLSAGREIGLTNTILQADAVGGFGGTINLTAPHINLTGSILTVATGGASAPGPDAGTITVNAKDRLMVSGPDSGLFASAGVGPFNIGPPFAVSGDAGSITIHAGQVQLKKGATISAASSGIGDGGTILADAAKTFSSDASIVAATASQGQAGNITINAGHNVQVVNGSIISADNTGIGNAGNLVINAGHGLLSDASTLSATALQGQAGNISIIAGQVARLLNGTLVTVNNNGAGNAGNITITAPVFRQDATSTVEAASLGGGQNGTVTINGVIQP
jgi:filamentous hemagglutinin family protein